VRADARQGDDIVIPRTLAYCWFGGADKSPLIRRCLESHALCAGYEVVEINESTWDIERYPYARDAYRAGKWAFVSDVARMDWLYRCGGITLDADVEILRPLDPFLNQRAFTSRESTGRLVSATIAAEASHPWIGDILDYYHTRRFVFNPSSMTNTMIIDEINRHRYSHVDEGEGIIYLTDGVAIYAREVFEAKNWSTGRITVTDATYAVHHYEGSWL
jgi:hypothetical protein